MKIFLSEMVGSSKSLKTKNIYLIITTLTKLSLQNFLNKFDHRNTLKKK